MSHFTEAPLAPFSSTYTPSLPELLHQLNASIAITTYQAGKLVFISPKGTEDLVSLPRTFLKPMGFDVNEQSAVIATQDEVITFENSKELATHYPNKPNTYDALYTPRVTFHTGAVDLHDITFGINQQGGKTIWAINTSFSCLCEFDGVSNFLPQWKPPFITELVSEDRCHLNGLIVEEGVPKYVTALGTTNTAQGWRENITEGGILMNIRTNEVILDELPMPHSPILHKEEIYFLLSATGHLVKVNLETKELSIIADTKGFCRGLDIIGDFAFVGMSKLRKNSSTFAKLPFAEKADSAGIKVYHIPTKAFVGEIIYKSSVDEIYEVKMIPNSLRPNILNTTNDIYKNALAIPGKTFWANQNRV